MGERAEFFADAQPWPPSKFLSLKKAPTMSTLKDSLAALIGLAAELHAVGAVRPDHDTKFSMLRGGLDQALSLADQAEEAASAAPTADAAAFADLADKVEALGHQVETVALTVDHTGDQVQSLVDLANAPKAG